MQPSRSRFVIRAHGLRWLLRRADHISSPLSAPLSAPLFLSESRVTNGIRSSWDEGSTVEVLANENGGVVYWGWPGNAFDPETLKH